MTGPTGQRVDSYGNRILRMSAIITFTPRRTRASAIANRFRWCRRSPRRLPLAILMPAPPFTVLRVTPFQCALP